MMEGLASNGPVARFDRFATRSFSSIPLVDARPRAPPSCSINYRSSSFFSILGLRSCVCPFSNPATPLVGRKTDPDNIAARCCFLCSAGAAEETTMASEDAGRDQRIARIASTIRVIPDFPKPGIIFQDITTLLLDHKAFKDTIDLFVERYKDKNISVIAGVEARGFIFGPPIALAIGAKFVPLRKPRKLPGKVISEEYSLEYGTDTMEMHVGAVNPGERALVIDDLIATGGTLGAAIRLLERVGAEVVECACVIELPELEGWKRLGDKPLFVLVSAV